MEADSNDMRENPHDVDDHPSSTAGMFAFSDAMFLSLYSVLVVFLLLLFMCR